MKFKISLLNNSYDFLKESYNYFIVADEFGNHEEKIAVYDDKVKWKMAYVTLVQAFELLIKEGLRTISPILIYENIDNPININSKTVSGLKGIERLSNCKVKLLDKDSKEFIKGCIGKRNCFMHYNALIDTAEIKPSYCKLFEMYIKLHEEVLSSEYEKFMNMLKKDCHFYRNIIIFAKDFVVFRNDEMHISYKEKFLREIEVNKYVGIMIDKNNKKYERIAYGKEPGFNAEVKHEFCPDCTAAIGEFHYECCDIEICPKCGFQLLSCECELDILIDKEN